MSGRPLYVKNPNGEDFICKVDFSPSLEETYGTEGANSSDAKLLIEDFSKDSAILNRSITKSLVRMRAVSADSTKRLTDFAKYLFDRKKAGVVKLGDIVIYLLPPSNLQQDYITCISSAKSQIPAPSAVPTGISSGAAVTSKPSTASSSATTSAATATAATAATTATAASSSSVGKTLFEILVEKTKNANRGSASTMAMVTPTAVLTKAEVVNSFQLLENRIRDQLKVFDDPDIMEFRFEPMDKDGRYVVHDVVVDFPHLNCAGVGDYEERHVVVYRKGFIPEGVEVHSGVVPAQVGVVATASMKPKRMKKQEDRAIDASAMQSKLVKANPGWERDRRTVAEVQEELKKRRLGEN